MTNKRFCGLLGVRDVEMRIIMFVSLFIIDLLLFDYPKVCKYSKFSYDSCMNHSSSEFAINCGSEFCENSFRSLFSMFLIKYNRNEI